jgi:hypothetical protein
VDQWISGGGGRRSPHGGAEARRKQREEPTTTTRHREGNWRVPCSCLCVETPVVAPRCFALPRSSILCGCIINIPGRQANAVRIGPMPCRMCGICIFKKTWSLLGSSSTKFLGCATRSWPCLVTALSGVFVGLVALGLFVHPLRTEFVPPPSTQMEGGPTAGLCHPLCAAVHTYLACCRRPLKSSNRIFGLVESLPAQEKFVLHRNLSPRHFDESYTIEP